MRSSGKPKLKKPVLVAGWPGMGLVAFKAVSYLIEHLGVEPQGGLDMADLYPLKSVSISNGLVEEAVLPSSRAFVHAAGRRGRDLVLFLGEDQPVHGKEWSVSNAILDMGSGLGATEVFTFAAMVTQNDHRARPRVWGCATNAATVSTIRSAGVGLMEEGQISGLNGLLLGVARARGMDGTCLLGELPYYLTQMAYPMASLAVLEAFVSITGTEVDLGDLRVACETTRAEIEAYLDQTRGETPAAARASAGGALARDEAQPPADDDDDEEEELIN